MTEYIIIVALIAIAAVAAVSFFGTSAKAQFVSMGAELLGEDGKQATDPVVATVGAEAAAAARKATLGTYND